MLRRIVFAVAVFGLISGPGLADAAGFADAVSVAHERISVSPGNGTPTTRFTVSFKAPNAAGGKTGRTYQAQATGPTSSSGRCTGEVDAALSKARAHARVSVKLFASGERLCGGTYHGVVRETQQPVCGPPVACPQYVVMLGTVGRFKFRVHRARSEAPRY